MLEKEQSDKKEIEIPKSLSEEEMDEAILLEDQEPTKDLSRLDLLDEFHWRKDE